ncbi:MAG: cytochrome P450 [Actinomycetota bacterium]|nr:cytochrome P450 [Actinomycetota bacterium]
MPSNLPPGPGLPGLLNTLNWQLRTTAFLDSAHRRYGDLWTLRLVGGTTFVMVSDPKLIEEVLRTDPEVLHAEARLATQLVGETSVLVTQGREHNAKRALLEPFFERERVRRYRADIQQICERELDRWPVNEPMRLLPRLRRITLSVMMSCVLGESEGPRHDALHARMEDLLGASPLRMAKHQVRYMRGWGPDKSFLQMRERVDRLLFEEIADARRDERLEERNDVLAMLVQAKHEDGSPLTDREIRDQTMTLLMQGYTSTANGLAWALERLMRHPQVLEQLRSEAQTDGEEYLDAVVKETLRLRPALPFVMRRVNKPYKLSGYDLEPETMIACNLYLLHRRADLFPEPDRFRPERFLEQQPADYTWIAFGGGTVRNCVGAGLAMTEIKVVLRTLMRRARLQPVEQRSEEIRRLGVGFTPSRGARAVLVERVPAAGAAPVG